MRPLILISNDDGYQAKGINELVRMVSDYGDVLVCAPDGARSGMSCAFSATIPLTLTLIRKEPGLEVWSCNGTPVDCVKMALANLCARKPDLVIGGINHGDNASVNTHYSGTMGVTMEGCMKYIPSLKLAGLRTAVPIRVYACVACREARGRTKSPSATIREAMTTGGW